MRCGALPRLDTGGRPEFPGMTSPVPGSRVWVFPAQVPDGGWGSRGAIRRLPEIREFISGERGGVAGERHA